MELVPGGELFDYIYDRGIVPEGETKFIFYQLLLAVKVSEK
jgi:serine/threonine protein kinase